MNALIVDDDIATVDVIRDTINWNKLGIEQVNIAYNIEQAKNILLNEPQDIIISDIEMPKGSGLDLLTWFREQEMEGEFLLLTCHESFDYATNAVRLHAAEYLLKPFDPVIMEAALRKMTGKLLELQQEKEHSQYGRWISRNQRQWKNQFWNMLLDASQEMTLEDILQELKNRNLKEDAGGTYRLVISRVTDIEKDKERMNAGLCRFVLENIHSEILCGNPENVNVVCYDRSDHMILVTVCRDERAQVLQENCRKLIELQKQLFSSTLTCCISKSCQMQDFYQVYHQNLQLITSNVVYFGSCFLESDVVADRNKSNFGMDLEQLERMLESRSKMEFLSILKTNLNEKIKEKSLNTNMMQQARQEILQAVYTYMNKRNMKSSGLYENEALEALTQKAAQSVIDMMRWVNFLIEWIYEYENEVQKKHSIIEKINQYIRAHYAENIGRNEVAAEFYLAPEYLAKLYKKHTGISLKDYLNEYRIEQAKILLRKSNVQVSDVAESVGFENFTYFSTVFKKYTGISPNQYKKQE